MTQSMTFNTEVLTTLKSYCADCTDSVTSGDGARYRDTQDLFYNSKKQLDNAQELLVKAIDNPTKKNITNVENNLELFNTKWRQAREYSLIGMLSV